MPKKNKQKDVDRPNFPLAGLKVMATAGCKLVRPKIG
jgi:hypothetical protein